MQSSQSYIFSSYQKFICPRCEFLLNSTVHVPIVAPCGHTFCNICIEEEYLEKKKFRCDLCKAETTEHFSKFPTNFYILNIRRNKIKNEYIFRGGKSPILPKDTNNYSKYTKSNSSNISITYSDGRSKKNLRLKKNYKINNEITYTFFNNKLEIIKREVEFKKEEKAIKPDLINNIDERIDSTPYRKMSFNTTTSSIRDRTIKKIGGNVEEIKEEEVKIIEIIDFYGEYIEKKLKYPALYNYFEMLKKIFKYGDKYNKKYCNQIFIFIFRVLMLYILLQANIYLIKSIDVALFFLFISILIEKENTIYEISTKIKMFLALSCFYFVENIVKSLGFKYLIDMSTYISNMSNATRTLYNLLVLGNESTLNLIVFTILNILSNLHLLN
jgi:hypothetical protein